MASMRTALLRPVDLIFRLVRLGILAALVVAAIVALMETMTASRECGGAFSRAFSSGFDRYHCDLVIRSPKNGHQIKIPILPK